MDYLSILVWITLSYASLHLIMSLVGGSNQKLPPGPKPLPIVGNLFLLGDKPHESLTEMAKIYGPVMSLQLGSVRTVVISSASMVKEVLQKNDASVCNRKGPDSFTALGHRDLSFIYLDVGERWKSFRRISNSHVFSRARLDASQYLRNKKLEELLSYLKLCSQAGDAVEIAQLAFNTSLNVLSNAFFSVDLADTNSSISKEFRKVFWQVMVEATKPNISDYFPVLRCIDLQKNRHRTGVYFQKMIEFFASIINQRLAQKQDSLDENDVLDSLLKISNENTKDLQLSHIPHFLLELFVAGTDTTSNTVEWAMTELLCSPNAMKKVREELERVVGKGIPIKEEDVPRLPYLEAVIKETFRKNGPVGLVYRRADSDIEVGNFMVPKNTQILINLWGVGKDPILWENPNSFEPERFVGREIDVKGQDFELTPFGAGRRICPGLPLAMRMIHLMVGSLINCFEWKLEDGVEPKTMDMDAKFGLTLQKTHPLRVIPVSII